MKRVWILLPLVLLLGGCGAKETLETVADDIPAQSVAQMREISVRLPDNVVSPVLQSDSEQVYLSEDYEIVVETRSAGDLNATVNAISGFDESELTVMHTWQDDVQRYDFVWVSAGESGDRLGRGVILDDGNYHYCLSVLRDAENQKKSQVVWSDVFDSFSLVPY